MKTGRLLLGVVRQDGIEKDIFMYSEEQCNLIFNE